jgi:exonuclease VII large subunit
MTPSQTIERITYRIEDYMRSIDAYMQRKGAKLLRTMKAKQRTLFDVIKWITKQGYTLQALEGTSEQHIIERLSLRIKEYKQHYDQWERNKSDVTMRYLRTKEQVLRDACAWIRKQGYRPGLTDGVIYQKLL